MSDHEHHTESSPETLLPANHDQHDQQPAQNAQKKRKDIKTFHCRYCSHLLLASTRPILSATTPLARRGGAARDRALILDIPARIRPATTTTPTGTTTTSVQRENGGIVGSSEDTQMADGEAAAGNNTAQPSQTSIEKEAHYTIPLATLLPDNKPVIIRRDDGFEKRILFKCGRCRVVVGYEIVPNKPKEEQDEEERVMYLLPGSLVGTEDLQEQGSAIETNTVLKQMEAEWAQWVAV